MRENRSISLTSKLRRGYRRGSDIMRVVVVHEAPHRNTVEHHSAWIELHGVRKDSDQFINLGVPYVGPSFPIRMSVFR